MTINRLKKLGFCTIAAAWLGCDTPVDEAAMQGAHALPATAGDRLQLTFHLGDGAPPPGGVFVAKDDVHLRTGLLDRDLPFGEADLAFTVVDGDGVELSRDALDCRRFRVEGGAGRIVEVHAGHDRDRAPCQRGVRIDSDGAMLLQLAPFADTAPNARGMMEFTVRVTRLEHFGGGGGGISQTVSGTVLIEVPPEIVCGDGHVAGNEECDDGNSTSGDGCSSVCRYERVCCCGDGIVNAGEDCDDGNTTSGDGCSSSCKTELVL